MDCLILGWCCLAELVPMEDFRKLVTSMAEHHAAFWNAGESQTRTSLLGPLLSLASSVVLPWTAWIYICDVLPSPRSFVAFCACSESRGPSSLQWPAVASQTGHVPASS